MRSPSPRFARSMETLVVAVLVPLILHFSPLDGTSLPAPIAAHATLGAPLSQPA